MNLKNPILFIPGVIAPYQKGHWKYFNELELIMSSPYYIAPLDNWGTLEQRSKELKNYIDQESNLLKFHIISHSKGGLDLEYLLDHYPEYEDRIISHTSLSCPYQGSIIAYVFWLISFPLGFIGRMKVIRSTLKQLFPKEKTYPKRSYREYYIGAYLGFLSPTYPLFWLTNIFILLSEGPNDGFVSVKSSKKGELLHLYKTDHIGLIGHFFTRKRKNILKNILKKIESKLNE